MPDTTARWFAPNEKTANPSSRRTTHTPIHKIKSKADRQAAINEFLKPAKPADSNICSVCHEEYGIKNPELELEPEKAVMLPCMHIFGERCLGEWMHTHGSCPMCRAQFAIPKNFILQRQQAESEAYWANHFDGRIARAMERDVEHWKEERKNIIRQLRNKGGSAVCALRFVEHNTIQDLCPQSELRYILSKILERPHLLQDMARYGCARYVQSRERERKHIVFEDLMNLIRNEVGRW